MRVYPTSPSREANIRFIQKNAKYNSIIVAIGGDGTLNELINGVMLSRIGAKIGFIPLGSTNDVAASPGLPQCTGTGGALHCLGKLIPYDVGQFNGEYFGYIAGTGAFTEVSYATSRSLKNALGHLAYVLEGVKNISGHPAALAENSNAGTNACGEIPSLHRVQFDIGRRYFPLQARPGIVQRRAVRSWY